MSRRPEKNILVISDLHLGEDLKENGTPTSYLRRLARLERELESFLAHYTAWRLDGRPWTLVINGDMVDFMSVVILPAPGEANDAADEERTFGLAHGERQSLRKLERVIERHRGVFGRLAAFVAAGNELAIVVGNHDVEFFYPSVQRAFVEALARLDPAAAEGRVRFCPWFFYEEELVYVEHGHQYDEYCSFDYQLHPVEERGHVALSIAHAGIRYFSNRVPQMDPHVAEAWGFLHYIRWAWAQGLRRSAQIFFVYGLMVWKLIEIWSKLTDRRVDAARRERHRARLEALAADYRIAVEKVEALDGLRREPVLKRFGRILQAMFIDRMLLGLGALAATSVSWALLDGFARAYAVGGTLLLALAINGWLDRGRMQPAEAALRHASQAIGRILRAPFIVFGHSHHAEAVPLADGGVYFNTGTWADEGGPGAFTHLVISCAGDAPRAELRQWRDGASAPFSPV